MVIRQINQWTSSALWCSGPLPLKEGLHVPPNQSAAHYSSLICPAWKWARWNGEGKNNLAIYKRPFSWRRSGPFPSLPSCFYKSVLDLFFPHTSLIQTETWNDCQDSGCAYQPLCACVRACVCLCEWCSGWSAPNPDWARSSYPKGITNRWLLVPLIPYTVKQALLENSHSNMSILSRLELEGRPVQPLCPAQNTPPNPCTQPSLFSSVFFFGNFG